MYFSAAKLKPLLAGNSTQTRRPPAVSVKGSLMQLNCFASVQEPGISNSSSILHASFIRCFVMWERTWQREQRVSYASRRSACGSNSVSSAGQEWRPRSPGEARRQWNSCSLRGGLADSHLCRKKEPWGWLRGGGGKEGVGWPRYPVRGILMEITKSLKMISHRRKMVAATFQKTFQT